MTYKVIKTQKEAKEVFKGTEYLENEMKSEDISKWEIKTSEHKPRNYVNEAKWYKNRYRRRVVCLLDKDNEKLEKILQKRNIGFTEWIKERIRLAR